MPAPYTTAQGTTFEFDGDEYYCTNIKVSRTNAGGNNRIDVSTLDLAEGSDREYQDPPLLDPNAPYGEEQVTVTIAFMGSTAPTSGAKGTLTISPGLTGTFRCTESETEYPVGDMVKGTATFVSAASGS